MLRNDEGIGFLLQYEHIAWFEKDHVNILDRRVYPQKIRTVECYSVADIAQAIKDMVTQSGGPYMAAAMGMVLSCHNNHSSSKEGFYKQSEKDAYLLSHARPTTAKKMEKITNRALALIKSCLKQNMKKEEIETLLQEDAILQQNEKYAKFEKVANALYETIPHNGTVMTQCFGETVVGCLLRKCKQEGNEIKLICNETRPYLQGARLTASLAYDMGFDTTVITDNMPGYVLSKGMVDVFTSAADVITMDGYVVNKIGTFQVATMANLFDVPYYVTGMPNKSHPTIDTVNIEERDGDLVLHAMGVKTTMDGVKGYYPSFDITPPNLVSGVVTDQGIIDPTKLDTYFEGGKE